MNLASRNYHVRSKNSSALVTVLALMTILTLILLAYLNLMRLDRLATRNYAEGLRAEETERGAMDFIVGQLRAEMASGTTPYSVGNYFIYTNITSANISPGPVATSSTVPALIKMSTNGLGVYSAAPATLAAINSVSSTASVNSRSINSGRWARPGFGTLPYAPSWYLIGAQGITNSVSPAVRERFAYAIYDLSSMADINVAGYPSSLSTAQLQALSGSLPGVSLATLTGMSQTASDALIQTFRNRTSAATATAYTNQVLNVAATNGFMTVSPGDDTFLSRQDFLAYAKLNSLTSAATNLTTYTRSVNGPSWSPTINSGTITVQTATVTSIYPNGNDAWTSPNVTVNPAATLDFNYQSNALAANSTNPNFLSQLVTATFTRFDGTTAVVGEPLVLKRFPLDRLAWLSFSGPSAVATAKFGTATAAAAKIKAAFGLVWDSTNKLWVYTSPASTNGGGSYSSGSSNGPASSGLAANTIKTLAVVASENREPDFFELLKAGILRGSLGIRSSINSPMFTVQPGEITPEGQVLQIGANIIDQYDTDDYPTLIRAYMPFVMRQDDPNTLKYSYGVGTAALVPYDFAGVENLPYLTQFRYRLYRPQINQGNPAGRPNVQASLLPQFWNPHLNAATVSSSRPAHIRIIQTFGSISAWLKPTTTQIDPLTGYSVAYYTSPPSEWPSSTTPAVPQPMIEFSGALTFATPTFLKPTDVAATPPSIAQDVRPAISAAVAPNPAPICPDPAGFVGFWLGEASGVDQVYDKNVWNANGGGSVPAGTDPNETLTQIALGTSLGLALPASDPFWKGDTISSGSDNRRWPVFELQYQDGSVWKTYQRMDGLFAMDWETHDFETVYPSLSDEYESFVLARLDPRGNRFGVMQVSNSNSTYGWGGPGDPSPPTTYFSTTMANSYGGAWVGSDAITGTSTWGSTGDPFAPGNQSGAQFFTQLDPSQESLMYPYTQLMDNIVSGQHFTDNDQVLRRGDGNTAKIVSPLSIPASQPVMLNRAFTSAADMGYAYRDLPFKTLDFFSANSADGALLDLFCLHESPVVVAGKINLNTPNATLLAQLLNNGTQVEKSGTALASTDATKIANALVATSKTTPFTGLWDLPGFLSSTAYTSAVTSTVQMTKTQMEVVPRQLSRTADTRCWNLLVDVITQSGRYASGETNPDKFTVGGERRYWLHLAIDRHTGKIVDEQLEPVFE